MPESKNQIPNDYSQSFFLQEAVGNNAFSFEERSQAREPRLFVPSLIEGTLDDVQIGEEIVFEEFEDGVQSFVGLKNFIHTQIQGKDIYVFDNHNHAFYFWSLHHFEHPPTVVHIDQHSDMRVPEKSFEEFGGSAFEYTNFHLNIGNFITPAIDAGMIKEVIQITGSDGHFEKQAQYDDIIMDLDLDYFAPEMDFISYEDRKQIVLKWLENASVITVATSPYFIDQHRAIEVLKDIFKDI